MKYVVLCICIFVFACLTHVTIIFDILEQSSFSKIYHMLGLSGNSSYAVFVYLCVYVFVYLYLRLKLSGAAPLIFNLQF